jgi:hypothetical protein
MESTSDEVNWSRGHYLEPSEVWSAFQLKGSPPERRGVGMNQPNPRTGGAWSRAMLAMAAVLLVYVVFVFSGGRVVHKQRVEFPNGAVSGAPEAAAYVGPIFVLDRGNLLVDVKAPVNNSWLYLDGALINDDTGEIDEFDMEVSAYNGVEDGEAWSEGSSEATAYLASVHPGRYTMRLAPQWEAGKPVASYDLIVKSRVPRFWHAFLAIAALLLGPLVGSVRRGGFEQQRWSQSDHPWISSSSEDDD